MLIFPKTAGNRPMAEAIARRHRDMWAKAQAGTLPLDFVIRLARVERQQVAGMGFPELAADMRADAVAVLQLEA